MTGVLDRIGSPGDLQALSADELAVLAEEIRDILIQTVSRTGGHLGPNLGAVELTIALHRVFDSPAEPLLWDVGHQAYVHKILTGRAERMSTLRQTGRRLRLPESRGEPARLDREFARVDGSVLRGWAVQGIRDPGGTSDGRRHRR